MRPAKRIVDAIVSLLAIAALFPVFAIVAVAIWVEDGRPVIFKQKRLGRNGSMFVMYKFRKLRESDNSRSTPILHDDNRYTNIGRILDRTKLNELPQLLNVAMGDMSVVGPRPEIPEFKHCFSGRYHQLLGYTPGIFGPSQSAFRNEAAMYPPGQDMQTFYEQVLFPQKAEIDLRYYPQANLARDLYWVLRSLAAVMGMYSSSHSRASTDSRLACGRDEP
jgi:lipopolysaccharide/colanic/teichoic acid biosynthesis glycosyltransferase